MRELESSERLQRFGTAVGLKRPNLQDLRRLGLLSPTASSNSSPQDGSELSGFGVIREQRLRIASALLKGAQELDQGGSLGARQAANPFGEFVHGPLSLGGVADGAFRSGCG